MKKLYLSAILLLALVVALSACGGGSGDGDSSNGSGFDTSRDITVIAREDGSGTKSAFMDIIGLGGKADLPTVIIQQGTAAVNAEIKTNPAAIAYESLGFIDEGDVKVLKIDGVAATVANIRNGTYKISRPLSVVYKESTLDDDVNQAFFIFLQSNAAQKIISDEGFVPVVDNALDYTIDGALSGVIDVSGSTSLQPLMIKLADEFESLQPNITVNISGGGSGTGYNNAESDVSAFGMISEVFDPVKRETPSLTFYEVAKDGIAVIIHKDNPLDSITMEQLKNVYDSEAGADAITVWNQLIQE